jgi:hypothetical protein
MLSVIYPVQVRAQTSGGSPGQLRTPAPQSSQNTQIPFQSAGTGSISSLVQQINSQLNNVLSGFQPGQVNQPDQVNVTSGQGAIPNTTGGVEGNVGGTDDGPPQTSEQVSVSGYLLVISFLFKKLTDAARLPLLSLAISHLHTHTLTIFTSLFVLV